MSVPPGHQPRPDRAAVPAEPPRGRRPAWLVPVVVVALLLFLLLLLSQCFGGDDDDPASGAAGTASPSPTTSTSPAPAATTPAAPTSPSTSETPALPQAGADDVLVTADGAAVLPLLADDPDAPLTAVVGQPVSADGVAVQAVVTDEGFWVGPDADQRVFVRFVVDGESAVDVQTGQTVDFDGVVTALPAGFVDDIGLEAAEGAAQLESQGAYVQVEPTDLEVVDQAR